MQTHTVYNTNTLVNCPNANYYFSFLLYMLVYGFRICKKGKIILYIKQDLL